MDNKTPRRAWNLISLKNKSSSSMWTKKNLEISLLFLWILKWNTWLKRRPVVFENCPVLDCCTIRIDSYFSFYYCSKKQAKCCVIRNMAKPNKYSNEIFIIVDYILIIMVVWQVFKLDRIKKNRVHKIAILLVLFTGSKEIRVAKIKDFCLLRFYVVVGLY